MNEQSLFEMCNEHFTTAKRQAQQLKMHARALGFMMRHAQALNLIAVAYGYLNWTVMCGTYRGTLPPSTPFDTTVARVQRAAERNGFTLSATQVKLLLLNAARPDGTEGTARRFVDAGVIRRCERARARSRA